MAVSRAKNPAVRRQKRTPMDVVLRITLDDIEPPIWREIALLDTTTLPELHRVIQLAFQWYDYHLHQFTIGDQRYAIPDEENDEFGVPARSSLGVTLSDLGLTAGAGSRTSTTSVIRGAHYRRAHHHARSGSRCGNARAAARGWTARRAAGRLWRPHGYEELLRVLAHPSDPEHAEMSTWVGPDFDAERFDARAVRHALIMTAMWGALR